MGLDVDVPIVRIFPALGNYALKWSKRSYERTSTIDTHTILKWWMMLMVLLLVIMSKMKISLKMTNRTCFPISPPSLNSLSISHSFSLSPLCLSDSLPLLSDSPSHSPLCLTHSHTHTHTHIVR